jgi:hypothetical protein
VPRAAIGDYLKRSGIEIVPTLEVDNFAMAMSLVIEPGPNLAAGRLNTEPPKNKQPNRK